jgi:hypothetical protein
MASMKKGKGGKSAKNKLNSLSAKRQNAGTKRER